MTERITFSNHHGLDNSIADLLGYDRRVDDEHLSYEYIYNWFPSLVWCKFGWEPNDKAHQQHEAFKNLCGYHAVYTGDNTWLINLGCLRDLCMSNGDPRLQKGNDKVAIINTLFHLLFHNASKERDTAYGKFTHLPNRTVLCVVNRMLNSDLTLYWAIENGKDGKSVISIPYDLAPPTNDRADMTKRIILYAHALYDCKGGEDWFETIHVPTDCIRVMRYNDILYKVTSHLDK